MSSAASAGVGLGVGALIAATVLFAVAVVFYYFCFVRRRRMTKGENIESGKNQVKKYGNVLGVPKAPLKVWVEDIQLDGVMLKWTPHSRDTQYRVQTYHIECRIDGQDWKKVGMSGRKDTQYQITGLKVTKTYFFRVSAESPFGIGPAQETPEPIQIHVPPECPSKLRCEEITYNSITLSWQPPLKTTGMGVESYYVMLRTNRGDWKDIGHVTSCSYTAEGLVSGNKYGFRIAAANRYGRGVAKEFPNPLSVKNIAVPSSPLDISVHEIKEESVKIGWSPPKQDGGAEIVRYHVMRQADGKQWEYVDEVTAATRAYNLTGLKQGKQYRFRVKAENIAGESNPAETLVAVALKKKIEVPKSPLEFFVKETHGTSVTLTWRPPLQDGGAKIKSYQIQVQVGGDDWEDLSQVWGMENTYTAKGLEPGVKYLFRICAENKAGRGPYLALKGAVDPASTVKPQASSMPGLARPGTPEGPLKVSHVTKHSLTVSWMPPRSNEAPAIDSYLIEYQGTKGTLWMKGGSARPNETQFTLWDLLPDTEYRIRVVSVNSKGKSGALETRDKVRTQKATRPITIAEFEDVTSEADTFISKPPITTRI